MKNAALPTEVTQLQTIVLEQREQINLLHQQMKLMRAAMFGRKSERLDLGLLGQANLFAGEETDAESPQPKPAEVSGYKRGKPRRKPLPEDLPRKEVTHDLSEEDKICGCGNVMACIGKETSEKLRVIPESFVVEQHIRPKYACRACEGIDSDGGAVRIAPMPPQLLPKSLATASLLAYIVISKYVDALPLYRLEQRFGRLNCQISRKTMTDWMIKVGEKLQPLWRLMLAEIKSAPWLGMDETRMRVFDKKDRKNKSKHRNGHMWVMFANQPHPIVLFRYHPGREADLPREVLEGYRGTVVTDEWRAYDFIDRGHEKDTTWSEIAHAGCWVHARRKFVEVIKTQGKKRGTADSLTNTALSTIKEMYRLEREASEAGFGEAERLAMRQEKIQPLLEGLREEMEAAKIKNTPVGTLKKAIDYSLRNWERLTRFLEDPVLPPDNNHVENAIRPFVIGRKNWIFAGSPEGAMASAIFYSLAETAKANTLNPFDYFTHLFEELPKAESDTDLRALLPTQISISIQPTA